MDFLKNKLDILQLSLKINFLRKYIPLNDFTVDTKKKYFIYKWLIKEP